MRYDVDDDKGKKKRKEKWSRHALDAITPDPLIVSRCERRRAGSSCMQEPLSRPNLRSAGTDRNSHGDILLGSLTSCPRRRGHPHPVVPRMKEQTLRIKPTGVQYSISRTRKYLGSRSTVVDPNGW